MAAKRNTGRTRQNRDGDFAVHVDKDEIEGLELSKPVALPAVGHGGDAADAQASSPKGVPTWRGTDRGKTAGRGQPARQGRRHAFRRS